MNAVSGERVIAAPAPVRCGRSRLALGSEFRVRVRIVVPHRMAHRTVGLEEDRRLAWAHGFPSRDEAGIERTLERLSGIVAVAG